MDDEGEAIGAAVVRYVSRHPGVLDRAELAPIRNGETYRDDDGILRIGSWRLTERDGDPVLVRRRGSDPPQLTVVSLEENDGDWRVTDVRRESPESGER